MEGIIACCVLGVASIFIFFVWIFSNLFWFEPKKKEKLLRDQGLNGSSYKFMFGDLKDLAKMTSEAKLKPMSLSHDIAPRVSPFFYRSFTTYGNNFFTWMGPKPMVHIYEPTMIREILSKYYQFQKERGGNPLIKFIETGLADVDADQWVKHRKIINPAFHVEKLKHMVPAFYVSVREMIQKWSEMLTNEGLCEVDVWPYIHAFTSDVISRTAFGSNFEEGKKIFELQKEQAKLVMMASRSLYIPGLRYLPTKRNKRMKEINREVNVSIRSIIDKRIDAMNTGDPSKDDLLGILLDSNYKEIQKHGNKQFGLSIDEVIEECKVFYFAGQDTTGNLLAWTMVLLGYHKDWQTHARNEVLHLFGKEKPDIDGLNRLKIINNIFNEVLRLYPPATILRRQIHKETKLGNLTLPAQTLIQINPLFLHHDPNIWGSDVHEFNPGRFSEGVSKVNKDQASYLPFGGGPRICIGKNFALLEAKMALIMVLQCFYFDISPSYSHAPHTIMTLQPQFGVHLILHKI